MSTEARIRRAVSKRMGLGEGALKDETLPEIHRIMQPHEGKAYPVRMDGDASKLPKPYLQMSWPQMDEALRALKRDPEIGLIIERHPGMERSLGIALGDALDERALKAYAEEWRMLNPEAISDLVRRCLPQNVQSTDERPPPYLANEYNARMIVPEIRRKIKSMKRVEEYVIMDLGVGAGGTISPIVEKLSPDERRRIRLILVDVMDVGLKEARSELERLGIGEKQITLANANISKIVETQPLRQFLGEVDLITSGAALHHVPDIRPTFEGAYRYLKKDGVLCFWDWGHCAWRAPTLLAAPADARILEHGRAYEKGRRTVEAPKGAAFFSPTERFRYVTRGRSPTELQTVREMLSTWIGLLRYPPEEKARFERFFDQAVKRGEPINYGEYLRKLEGKKLAKDEKTGQPSREAGIYYWEGHRPPELYSTQIMEVFGERPFTIYSTDSNLLYQMRVRKR